MSHGRVCRVVALASAAALGLAESALARELLRGEPFGVAAHLEHKGSLRELLVGTRQTDRDAFFATLATTPSCLDIDQVAACPAFDQIGDRDVLQSSTRLRNELNGFAGKRWSARVVYDHFLFLGPRDTLEAALASQGAEQGLFDADGQLLEGDLVEWRHRLYRGSVSFRGDKLDVRVGRQRVAWGVGRVWNPMDRMNFVGPLAFEAQESPGVDAVLLRWNFSGFDAVEGVYAFGEDRALDRAALRLQGGLGDVDLSVMAGRFQEAWAAGADLETNLGDAALHAEVVWTRPEREVWLVGDAGPGVPGAFVQAVASIDYNFDLRDGVYVLVEHLYNGNALGFGEGRAGPFLNFFEVSDASGAPLPVPAGNARFAGSQVVTSGEQLTAFNVATDVTPELRADVVILYDWQGQSAAFLPRLLYSPLGSLEVSAGVQVFAGGRRSEFGTAQASFFFLAQWFF